MSTPIRVLIVEDSEDDAALLVGELHRGGYEPACERVETAEAMKAALDRQPWDIVIVDYILPHFGGLAALKILQEKGLDMPFIVVSGSIGEDIAVAAMKAGAHDYIMKDNPARLIPAIERELKDVEERRRRKRAEEQHRQSEERFRQIAESIREVFWMTNPDKNEMLYISPGYETIWGRTCKDLYEHPESWLETIHPEDRDRVLKAAMEKQGQGTYDEEYRILQPDDSVRWIRDRAFPVRDESGRVYRITGIAEDITDRRKAEEMVQRIAFYDTLTGLPNRNMLYDRLLNAIRTGGDEGRPMALLLMDLDRFREINDTLGHHRGDILLQQVGSRLQGALRPSDIVARLGGDEFAVVLPLAGSKDAALVADKILKALEPPFIIEGLPIVVEASIGLALYPDHGGNPDSLMQRADVAMYAAKRTGEGCIIYETKHDLHSPRRLALMGELRRAIEQDQLFLHYQPKIDLKTRQVIGVEALARWKHPEHGFVPPDQFIPSAEKTGLIKPLTLWVFSTAQRQCLTWHRAGKSLTVSINLSARNLHDPELPDHLAKLIETCGGKSDRLELEITESAIMADPARALEAITRLRAVGIRFAIDDFGTGYSSLAYLKKLPVDTIKIDKSFVIHMAQDENDAVIVRSTIELGHNLGLKVVAEGVENKEAWNMLAALGCDAAQGYYMCRPIPGEELTRWFGESPWGLKPADRL
ncbi:MAG TPA: EAL domain-containing protein [Nitrospiria bacterium]